LKKIDFFLIKIKKKADFPKSFLIDRVGGVEMTIFL